MNFISRFLDNFFGGTNRKQTISWALFDFANSAYAVLIMGFIFPIFFKEVIVGGTRGDFIWGLLGSIAVLLAGFISPVVGAMADYDSKRKNKFVFFVLLATVGAASLYFTGSGKLFLASVIFIITNLCFLLASTLYDSFLAHVSTKQTAGRVSGLGYGLGYLGGVVAILAFSPLYAQGYVGNLENLYKLTFPFVALFLLIFSIPSFLFISQTTERREKHSLWYLIKKGFVNVFRTLKEFKKRKQIAWFLIAFYLMDDALVTLFIFISLYASSTLSLTIKEIGIILLLVQLIAIPAAIFLGWLSDRVGQKPILLSTIIGWIAVVVLLYLAPTRGLFFGLIIGILTGLVIGGSQSIARSWFSNIVPSERRFGLFGFNSFASKISAVLGPLIFGAVSTLTGSQRWGMLSLLPFFIVAFIIFSRINEKG